MASLSPVVLALVFANLCMPTCAYHFLILGGDGGGSHYYDATAIGKELVYRGNNVTVLVSDMYAKSVSKGEDSQLFNFVIYKSLVTEDQFQNVLANQVETGMRGDMVSMIKNIALAEILFYKQCRSILIDDPVIDLLHSEKFDLIIGDFWYICVGLVAQLLETPFALLTPTAVSMSMQSQINVCPTNPAYIPELVSGLDTKLSFFGRVSNTLILSLNSIANRRMLHRYDQLKVDLNIKPQISTYDALSEAELFFVNTNFVFDFPRPLMPHVVPVGGLTTKPSLPLKEVNISKINLT
ncbi:UDP-glucuronosyltransferase 1-2-like [Amphiura filiformis]|uniref:UDP-glucuronosyltransferase 1-2-like n=1 Tax=Amphiura filiformis TaxID=82378 RepID=UPI003B20D2CF